jgi:lysophospholipase L1-like esterase
MPTENARYKVEGCLLIDPKSLRGMQILARYEHAPKTLNGVLADGLDLPKTYALLKEKKRLKIALFGDSISNSANSSWEMGFDGYEHWFSPVISYLYATYGAEVEFINVSRSGYGTDWALTAVDEKFQGEEVDLAIVAFGMNDGTAGMGVEQFTENTALVMDKIRAHNKDTEFVLIATPVPNPDCDFYKAQKEYIHGLRTLETTGVTVLNMTEAFNFLLTKKRYCEIGGNNMNHPNDFGYAFYTDAFKVLFDTIRKGEE